MSKFFITTLVAFMLVTPFTASAATANFFGPIISTECNCEGQTGSGGVTMATAPDYGCVLQTVQNLVNLTISLSVIVAVFVIVLVSFQFMMSVTNPEAKTAAKQRLISVLVGMLLILSAWLIVDFVMKSLYDSSGDFGPWNSILMDEDGENRCIQVAAPPPPLPSITVATPGAGTGTASTQTGTTDSTQVMADPDGQFSYDSATVKSQRAHASGALSSLLSCMAGKLPGNVGRISSISDSKIVNGAKTFAQCRDEGNARFGGSCAHAVNSCHYGGRNCVGASYAVDFGDEENASVIIQAATQCGASDADVHNGNHVHVNVNQTACGCS